MQLIQLCSQSVIRISDTGAKALIFCIILNICMFTATCLFSLISISLPVYPFTENLHSLYTADLLLWILVEQVLLSWRWAEPHCISSVRGYAVEKTHRIISSRHFFIQYNNQQMHSIKYNKRQMIKHNSWCVQTPTCFGTKVPSSGSLISQIITSPTCHFRY